MMSSDCLFVVGSPVVVLCFCISLQILLVASATNGSLFALNEWQCQILCLTFYDTLHCTFHSPPLSIQQPQNILMLFLFWCMVRMHIKRKLNACTFLIKEVNPVCLAQTSCFFKHFHMPQSENKTEPENVKILIGNILIAKSEHMQKTVVSTKIYLNRKQPNQIIQRNLYWLKRCAGKMLAKMQK